MYADVMQVVELKIVESAEVVHHQNCDDFAFGHFAGTIAGSLAGFGYFFEFSKFLVKFFTEFVCDTINFSNFVLSENG
jgi:hypothetical protein